MASGVIINAAAYSHTSIAIHDALAMLDIPAVEVHISNVYKREEFRHHSYVSSVVKGVICGRGVPGYTLALDAILADISK
jgi:3-dehydroquinate dehydratase-2